VLHNATSLSIRANFVEHERRNEGSTYSVYRCRRPPYHRGTTAVVNDGAYGAGGVSFPLANARPRTPCAPCDLEADERDAPSHTVPHHEEYARI